jgi:hypothetical protein
MDEVFDGTAAERIEQRLEEIGTTLTGAENGWVFPLFTDTESFGAYTMALRFHDDGTVDVSIESHNNYLYLIDPEGLIDVNYSATSTYSLKASQGAVLSFDTYNELFHFFSDPMDDGVGFGGDLEFSVISLSPDEITMKGVKRGTRQTLRRLPPEVSPAAYLSEVDKTCERIFRYGLPYLQVGDKQVEVTFDGWDRRILAFTGDEGTPCQAPFALYAGALSLYEPVTLAGKTFRNFTYDASRNAFLATDPGAEGVAFANSTHPAGRLNVQLWWFNDDDGSMSASCREAWQAAQLSNAEVWGEDFVAAALGYGDYGQAFFFASGSPDFGVFTGNLPYHITPLDGNLVTLGYTGGFINTFRDNGQAYYFYVPGLVAWIDFIGGSATPRTYTMDVSDDETRIKLTDAADPGRWFILYDTEQ